MEINNEMERFRRLETRPNLKDHIDTIKHEWREIVPVILVIVGGVFLANII